MTGRQAAARQLRSNASERTRRTQQVPRCACWPWRRRSRSSRLALAADEPDDRGPQPPRPPRRSPRPPGARAPAASGAALQRPVRRPRPPRRRRPPAPRPRPTGPRLRPGDALHRAGFSLDRAGNDSAALGRPRGRRRRRRPVRPPARRPGPPPRPAISATAAGPGGQGGPAGAARRHATGLQSAIPPHDESSSRPSRPYANDKFGILLTRSIFSRTPIRPGSEREHDTAALTHEQNLRPARHVLGRRPDLRRVLRAGRRRRGSRCASTTRSPRAA